MRDLIKGAKRIMDLHVKPGEDVLIVATTDKEEIIPDVLALAAQAAGANEVVVASIPPRSARTPDVPKCIIEAVRKSDVVFSTSKASLVFTSITKVAGESGGKVRHIAVGVMADQLKSGGIWADYNKVREVTLRLCRIMEKSRQGWVTTERGTDLTFRIGRSCCEFFGIPHATKIMPWWASAPCGETMTAIIEDTPQGKLVTDVSIVSSSEALPSCILSQPVELEIKDGTVVDIKGGLEAATLRKVLEESDKNAWRISEFALGTNPEAKIFGAHEDKKRLGTCHFALGSNDYFGGKIKSKMHVDLVANKPTVILDKKTVMKNGKLLV